MHEISLVRNIFRTLENEFSEAEIEQIKTIKLKVGTLSNIEPTLMQNAFEAVTATDFPQYRRAVLAIETVPIEIFCNSCQVHSHIEHYRFVCAQCGQPNNNITKGMELLISGVEF